MNELISKKDVLREIISSFEWYHTNYGYRNGADILRDNLIESIKTMPTTEIITCTRCGAEMIPKVFSEEDDENG